MKCGRFAEGQPEKQKLEQQQAVLRDELHNRPEIKVFATNIYPEGDAEREDDVPVASLVHKPIAWGDIRKG